MGQRDPSCPARALPPAGSPMPAISMPGVTTSQEITEFEFRISPTSSRPTPASGPRGQVKDAPSPCLIGGNA
jgi:hypothetical protein